MFCLEVSLKPPLDIHHVLKTTENNRIGYNLARYGGLLPLLCACIKINLKITCGGVWLVSKTGGESTWNDTR